MPNNPKDIEIKYNRFLNALKTLAPTKTFGGVTLDAFETQTGKSDLPREMLVQIDDQRKEQEAGRESADSVTMQMCEMIKNGVLADPEFGEDSALYEALGFVRKSMRKSGLTRKRVEPVKI